VINFQPTLLSPDFILREIVVSAVGPLTVQIVPENLNRVGLVLTASGGGYVLRAGADATSTLGFSIAVGALTQFKFADFGTLIGQRWSAFIVTVATIYGWEIIFQPATREGA
jgi:hypothetical protein